MEALQAIVPQVVNPISVHAVLPTYHLTELAVVQKATNVQGAVWETVAAALVIVAALQPTALVVARRSIWDLHRGH